MIKKVLVLFILMHWFFSLSAQEQQPPSDLCHCPSMAKAGKGTFYLTYGYNLDWFTKSDIHFRDLTTENYDFTLYNVKAEDRPGLKDYFHQNLTIPQYSYRFGYFLNDKNDLGFEINYDHVKYIAIQDQQLHIKGQIHGEYFDKDTTLAENFIRYEHTNGANYLMINGVKRLNFLHAKNELHWLSGMFRAGGGIVLPRSDTWLWGHHRNDSYHIAGYVLGIDVGLRYDFLKHFFMETSGKGAFANYTNIYLWEKGRANQHWFSFEYIFAIGFQFGGKLF